MEGTKENPEVYLAQHFHMFLKKKKVVDPKFMVLPWKEKSEEKSIITSDQISKTLNGLKKYFNQASPRPWGGALDINIWTLLDMTHQELMDEILWWLKDERMSLWGLRYNWREQKTMDGHHISQTK